jgi:hypothetical protein
MPPEEVEKLITELTAWCEAKYGRQTELADRLGVSRQLVANRLADGKNAEKFSQPRKAVRSVHIQPLSSLLPKVGPIHDLQITTKRLQRVDRIYAVANLAAVTTLATNLVYTFLTCISVF